jgi:hypothetical protein
MRIVRTSTLTGETNIREINVTEAQIEAWEGGELIQDAMPNLSAGDREFIKTGITDDEWQSVFGADDSEED